MPVLWIARARTSGQEVGPKMASSRNAQIYSGMARTKIMKRRHPTTIPFQNSCTGQPGDRKGGRNGNGVARVLAAPKASITPPQPARKVAATEMASVVTVASNPFSPIKSRTQRRRTEMSKEPGCSG